LQATLTGVEAGMRVQPALDRRGVAPSATRPFDDVLAILAMGDDEVTDRGAAKAGSLHIVLVFLVLTQSENWYISIRSTSITYAVPTF